MTVPSLEELDSFKYSDLQNLAKSLGLRANLRADKLLKALKAHLQHEAKKNENQDGGQTSASSCDEAEMQMSSQEQAERLPVDHVTKMRRRRGTVHRNPDSQDHSEIKISDLTEFQNQEKQENQNLRTVGAVPSPPEENAGEENAVSSGKGGTGGMPDK